MKGYRVVIDYTNWKGVRRERSVFPLGMEFAATQWHPEPQWLVLALDLEDGEEKRFAMKDIHSWRPA